MLEPRVQIEPSEPGPARQRQRGGRGRGRRVATTCNAPATRSTRRSPGAAPRAVRRGRPRAPPRPGRRTAAAAQPAAARPGARAPPAPRRGGRRPGRRRARATPRPAVEVLAVVADEIRLPGEHLDEVAAGVPLELRDHLAPQPHPPVPDVVVHQVLDRREPEPGADLTRLGPPEPEQRPPQVAAPGRHARRARCVALPRSRFSSTVSAWSSRVCADERSRRRRRSAPHRFERGVPRVARARFEVAAGGDVDAHGAEVGTEARRGRRRRHRRRAHRRADRDRRTPRTRSRPAARSEREQRERVGAARAPDDDAAIDVVERGEPPHERRERRRGSQPVSRRCGCARPGRSRPRASSSSASVGRFSGSRHTTSSVEKPPISTTSLMKRSPTSYCFIFCSRPKSLCICPVMPARGAALVEHARHALLTGDVAPAELGHDDVAVALEQRHQRLHPIEDDALLRRREQADEAALVERVAAVSHLVERTRDRLEHRARVRVDDVERVLHERQEVRAHPRHAGELRAVRHLVDRDPQPEVAGPEREALLQRQDVRADVVDGIAVRRRRGRAGRTARARAATCSRSARRSRWRRRAGRSVRTRCAPAARRPSP